MKYIFLLCITLVGFSERYAITEHPLKLTSSEITYDEISKGIKVDCKVFIDDFSKTLNLTTLKDESNSKLSIEDLRRIEFYFIAQYKIAINGKTLPWKLKSYKIADNVITMTFFEAHRNLEKGDTLIIENTLLFDIFGYMQSNWIMIRFPPFLVDYSVESSIGNANHTFSF